MFVQNIVINAQLEIPLAEISFRFSRSGGPGGQNVNRVESRVELVFDLANSPSLSDEQRQILMERLKTHLDQEGFLHIVSQTSRSQVKNREEAVTRFQALLQFALKPRKKRKPTRPSRASKERRLQEKKRRGEAKKSRKSHEES
ncbi:aminoacyl-tRNA hydrolase [Candidatus Acetothermia bacterium]|nr:aminoacyl-tRNA hydrolase [Candidatus Acetothermia bacterium]MBI3644183.1 aminoacyl-tRNA hydrolase [Candidatus Acetothermia bacterium]